MDSIPLVPPNSPPRPPNDSGDWRTSPPFSPPARRRGPYASSPPSNALPTNASRQPVYSRVATFPAYSPPGASSLAQPDGHNGRSLGQLSLTGLPPLPPSTLPRLEAQSSLSPYAALFQSDSTTSSSNSSHSFNPVIGSTRPSDVLSTPSGPTSPSSSSGGATNTSRQPEMPAHSADSLWRYPSPQASGADQSLVCPAPASPTPEEEVANALRIALGINNQTPMQWNELKAAVIILFRLLVTSSSKPDGDDALVRAKDLAKGFEGAADVLSARVHQMAPAAQIAGMDRNGMFNHSNPALLPPGLQASDAVTSRTNSPAVMSRTNSPSSPSRF